MLSSLTYNEPTGVILCCGGEGNSGVLQEIGEYNPITKAFYQTQLRIKNFRMTAILFVRTLYNFSSIIAGT